MAQLFPRSANDLARISLIAIVVLLAAVAWGASVYVTSNYETGRGEFIHQPVPFSHEHHVAGLGIDCRYCHTSVEKAAFAGIPPIATCMNCHKQIWTNAQLLEPIREAYRTGVPVQWQRVNDLPDFVYFNHSVHIAKGIGCSTCHGPVDRMPLMRQEATLRMQWCLQCHNDPARFVRPRDQVFSMDYQPPPAAEQRALGARLVKQYDIQSLTSCSTCHR